MNDLYGWMLRGAEPPTAVVRPGDDIPCDHCSRAITGGEVVTYRRRDLAATCPTCAAAGAARS
ncbi:MAG TPA: hypothetical protein VEX86_20900 [Longimicrobium sp.]|nr:hypothetical protein [Longimicrobium sp.]